MIDAIGSLVLSEGGIDEALWKEGFYKATLRVIMLWWYSLMVRLMDVRLG